MKTKKAIINLMKQVQTENRTGTILFKGLTADQVDQYNKELIETNTKKLAEYNQANNTDLKLEIDENKISVGSNSIYFLAKPIPGPVIVRSQDYKVGRCWAKITDIMPETFAETDKTFGFQSKSGNFMVFNKN